MGSMKMSKILTLGVLEAEKLQTRRWLKFCGTPCKTIINEELLVSYHDLGDVLVLEP